MKIKPINHIVENNTVSEIVNTAILIKGEMLEDNGEDSYSYCFHAKNGFMAVFDGCGGLGAKRYSKFNGKTGAYISSRTSALITLRWYIETTDFSSKIPDSEQTAKELEDITKKGMELLKEKIVDENDAFGIKGSLSKKSFPTTACSVFLDYQSKEILSGTFLWAGDSRGYILDNKGLSQITVDDIENGQDAFSNLHNDSILENMINADTSFTINNKSFRHPYPIVLIVSTDGCFSYFQTPMEFEYALLLSLKSANNINEWEINLNRIIREYASDDYTILLTALGFDSFKHIKRYFSERLDFLFSTYISCIYQARKNNTPIDLISLWNEYKQQYYR